MSSPLQVGGYVLAGGRSSRMGRDKALLPLAGKPLLEHALRKLRRVCAEVSVLGARPELEPLGRLVPDVHPGCGPLGGIEAALLDSRFPWNLIAPVDVPFVPTALLAFWAKATLDHGTQLGTRLALFTVGDQPQPALLMVHRTLLPFVSDALARGERKLLPLLEESAQEASRREATVPGPRVGRMLWAVEDQFRNSFGMAGAAGWEVLTPAQQGARGLWFANLNTPEDVAEAERHAEALDT